MIPENISKELRLIQKKYRDRPTATFDVCISHMAKDAADTIDELLNKVNRYEKEMDALNLLLEKDPALEIKLNKKTTINGETSDGYHTFNELYHHRAVLFSVICNSHPSLAWKSKHHSDGTMFDGMFIVGIQTPEGQATYHYNIIPYWEMFNVKELEFSPEWDGHTPDEAISRISSLNPPQTDILVSMVEEEMEETALNKKNTSSTRSGRYPWKSKEKENDYS